MATAECIHLSYVRAYIVVDEPPRTEAVVSQSTATCITVEPTSQPDPYELEAGGKRLTS